MKKEHVHDLILLATGSITEKGYLPNIFKCKQCKTIYYHDSRIYERLFILPIQKGKQIYIKEND